MMIFNQASSLTFGTTERAANGQSFLFGTHCSIVRWRWGPDATVVALGHETILSTAHRHSILCSGGNNAHSIQLGTR